MQTNQQVNISFVIGILANYSRGLRSFLKRLNSQKQCEPNFKLECFSNHLDQLVPLGHLEQREDQLKIMGNAGQQEQHAVKVFARCS